MSVMGGGFNRSPAGPLHVTPAHNPVQRAASPCRREPRFEMLGIGSRHLSEPTARHHTHRQLLKAPQPTQPPLGLEPRGPEGQESSPQGSRRGGVRQSILVIARAVPHSVTYLFGRFGYRVSGRPVPCLLLLGPQPGVL